MQSIFRPSVTVGEARRGIFRNRSSVKFSSSSGLATTPDEQKVFFGMESCARAAIPVRTG